MSKPEALGEYLACRLAVIDMRECWCVVGDYMAQLPVPNLVLAVPATTSVGADFHRPGIFLIADGTFEMFQIFVLASARE